MADERTLKEQLVYVAEMCGTYDAEHNIEQARSWGRTLGDIMDDLWLETEGTDEERMAQMDLFKTEVEFETGYHIIWP